MSVTWHLLGPTEVRVDDVHAKRRILDEGRKDFFPVKLKRLVRAAGRMERIKRKGDERFFDRVGVEARAVRQRAHRCNAIHGAAHDASWVRVLPAQFPRKFKR